MPPEVFEITIEEEFILKLYEASAQKLPKEVVVNLLIQSFRQIKVKDKIIAHLLKSGG